MGRPSHATQAARGDTQTLLLRHAQEVLQTQSFPGLTFQAVADRAGVKKATLYHYFPTKDDLGLALMRRNIVAFDRWTTQHTGTPEQRLTAFVQLFRNLLEGGQRVCPASAFAASWDTTDPELQQTILSLRARQIAWLTLLFQEAGQSAETARRSARRMGALVQGAVLAARVERDVEVFDNIMQDISSLLLEKC